jgi:HSP20 family molecular chaperone IbpA
MSRVEFSVTDTATVGDTLPISWVGDIPPDGSTSPFNVPNTGQGWTKMPTIGPLYPNTSSPVIPQWGYTTGPEDVLDKHKVDIRRDSKSIYYDIECAGYDQDQIEIDADDDELHIKLLTKQDSRDEFVDTYDYDQDEIPKGEWSFTLSVNKKRYDTKRISASLERGVLTIRIEERETQLNTVPIVDRDLKSPVNV